MALVGSRWQDNTAQRQPYKTSSENASANNSQHQRVLFGNRLHYDLPTVSEQATLYFSGTDGHGKHSNIPISDKILSRHIMLLGGIGTGKTNTFFQIINQIQDALTSDDIMVIFDTKGDFYQEFYRTGDIVISNDNTSCGPDGNNDYWNIFNEVSPGEQEYTSVMEISKSIFAEACKKTNQIFFPNAARDIFMCVMLHFLRYSRDTGITKFLNNESLIDFINSRTSADLREMLNSYTDMRSISSYISVDDSPQTQGVLSELQQEVRSIFVGNFAKKGTLGLRNLVHQKQGRKVFIEYDLSYGEVLTPVYSLMFDMAIKEALGRNRSEGNIYFITDEFRLLPNLQHIDDAVNFGRSLGIKFMIGIQNIEQIYENYGAQRADSIMSGFLTSINFRVNDPKSRQYIEERFGKNRKIETYATTIQNKMTEQTITGSVVEDWDINNLKTGQAIIGFPFGEPFIFQFDEWKS